MCERRLIHGFPLKRIELSIDQQQFRVNWSHRDDRRNIYLLAIGACDIISGYQFPMVINFDPNYQLDTIDDYADKVGDLIKPYPFLGHDFRLFKAVAGAFSAHGKGPDLHRSGCRT